MLLFNGLLLSHVKKFIYFDSSCSNEFNKKIKKLTENNEKRSSFIYFNNCFNINLILN
jgi:hypothetical protein